MNNHDHHGHQHEHGEHKSAPENIALNPDADGSVETTLQIAGMDCADEVEALEQVLRPLKGVREVRVNLMGGKVTLLHDESVNARKLIEAIAPTGLKAAEEGSAGEEDVEGAKRQRQIAVAVSGVFTGLGLRVFAALRRFSEVVFQHNPVARFAVAQVLDGAVHAGHGEGFGHRAVARLAKAAGRCTLPPRTGEAATKS